MLPGRARERRLRFLFSNRNPKVAFQLSTERHVPDDGDAGEREAAASSGLPKPARILAEMWSLSYFYALEGHWEESEAVYRDIIEALPDTLFEPLGFY